MGEEAIKRAVAALEAGGVIAYPTEAVYGLGCDPLREDAVTRLLQLKHRPRQQGLIVIASEMRQLSGLIDTSDTRALARAQATWPGPVTWVFPARGQTPDWLTGARTTLAVRITAHPMAHALCAAFGRALVSTSANVTGAAPARSPDEVNAMFGDKLDFVLEGEIGSLRKPTAIRDAVTGATLRDG